MKRIMFLLAALTLITAGASASKKKDIIRKEKGLITFTVDRDLPEPSGAEDKITDGRRIMTSILADDNMVAEPRIVASSFSKERLGNYGKNPFFKGMTDAFADHRPVVLSPDVIWSLISQGFANHVSRNPEEMRHLFVDHEGKIDLLVETAEDLLTGDADWNGIVDGFYHQIADNTKDGIAQLMAQPFSTTGPNELMASQVVLMKTMESYFQYIVIYMGCGIPSVTLTGTPQDWQSILDRVKEFRRYGLDWWVDDLEPILTEFVKASKGKPDTRFWQSIVKKYRPGEMRGAACGFDESTELDGWFLKFFPYDRNGRLPEKVRITHEMLPEQVTTQFKYVILDAEGSGQVLSEMQMELCAGIVGISFDEDNWTSTPKIGWFVRVSETEQEMLEKMYAKDRTGDLNLRVDRVPDVLRHAAHIKTLKLTFVGKVNLPEWLEKKDIDHLVITNELSAEEQASLRERFPNIQFSRW
ncbi:MAG: DUF4419 domain-containing protein [Bacteroidaceae bacterium]|nr:DUF4419 domain-containing protein [Bacteroidaceae bacterium]